MKSLKLILVLIVFAFASCDKISNPIVKRDAAFGTNFIKNNNLAYSNYKKVLLEDYTGHRCPNCPTANNAITNVLIPRYGDSLVVVAVHQGELAAPLAKFTNDYRTEAGESWGSSSGYGIVTWPIGLIDRTIISTKYMVPYTAWNTNIAKRLKTPFYVKLDLFTEYDPDARALNLSVKSTFNTSYTNTINIVAVYLQDGIEGPQDEKGIEIEYEFEHMLRGDINGAWGTELIAGPISAGDTANVAFNNFALPNELSGISNATPVSVDDSKVYVVVFVYDKISREILQVEKLKIRPAVSITD